MMIKGFAKKTTLGLMTLCLSAVALESAQATYFIRPFIQIGGGGLIDGLDQNGATQGFQNFGTDFETEVDLNDGTVRPFLFVDGPNLTRQSGGSFGERLEFSPNAVGTTVDFSFDIEGEIDISGLGPGILASTTSIAIFSTLFVFESTAGATFANFNTLGGELIGQSVFDTSFSQLSGQIANQGNFFHSPAPLFGSIVVEANKQYDVFASLSVSVATNLNSVAVLMDFTNTGTFDIGTFQGVTYTSESGIFLDSTGVTGPSVVPLPAALPLFASALALSGIAGWRKKKSQA